MNIKTLLTATLCVAALLMGGCTAYTNLGDLFATGDRRVVLVIDGSRSDMMPVGNTDWTDFVQTMLRYAEEGHDVTIQRTGSTSRTKRRTRRHTFITHDRDQAYRWILQMERQGYRVSVSYNADTMTYHCIAVR